MTTVHKITECPAGSLILKNLGPVDYFDSYMVVTKGDPSIEEIKRKIFTLPGWIEALLKFRYMFIARPFGLSTGRKEMTEIDRSDNEVVLGDDDKHLYFRLSILKKPAGSDVEVYLTTIVKFHNIWGRLYFLPVKQFHKQVVKTLLRKL